MQEACMRAVFLEKAAETQHRSYAGGAASPLSEDLAIKLGKNAPYDLINAFYWNYYERQLQAQDPSFRP